MYLLQSPSPMSLLVAFAYFYLNGFASTTRHRKQPLFRQNGKWSRSLFQYEPCRTKNYLKRRFNSAYGEVIFNMCISHDQKKKKKITREILSMPAFKRATLLLCQGFLLYWVIGLELITESKTKSLTWASVNASMQKGNVCFCAQWFYCTGP